MNRTETKTETKTERTFEVIAVDGSTYDATATDGGLQYNYEHGDIVSITEVGVTVETITTTTRRIIYTEPTEEMYAHSIEPTDRDYQEMSEHFETKTRKPRKVETSPRLPCISSCCGTLNRRTRNGTCAGCRKTANRTQLPRYFTTPSKRMWWNE